MREGKMDEVDEERDRVRVGGRGSGWWVDGGWWWVGGE